MHPTITVLYQILQKKKSVFASAGILGNLLITVFCVSYYCTVCRMHRLPPTGGRGRIFTDVQETAVIDMVIASNAINLREIRDRVLRDNTTFASVNTVSTTTIARVLEKHKVRMKQLYKVPFERKDERVKQLCYQYVQVRCLCNY